jgi:hypothetical protein
MVVAHVVLASCIVVYASAIVVTLYWDMATLRGAEVGSHVSSSELANALLPGDVVAFSSAGPSVKSALIAAYMRTPYLHVGLVIEGGLLAHFVSPDDEAFFGIRGPAGPGPIVGPLYDVLERYRSEHAIVAAYRSPHQASVEWSDVALSFCNREYDTASVSSYFKSSKSSKLNCITFVGAVLERVGTLPPSVNPSRDYSPGAFYDVLRERGGFHKAGVFCITGKK